MPGRRWEKLEESQAWVSVSVEPRWAWFFLCVQDDNRAANVSPSPTPTLGGKSEWLAWRVVVSPAVTSSLQNLPPP